MLDQYRQVFELLTPSARKKFAFLAMGTLLSAFIQIAGIGSVVPIVAAVSKPELLSQNPDLRRIVSFLGLSSAPLEDRILTFSILLVTLMALGNIGGLLLKWYRLHLVGEEQVVFTRRLLGNYSYKPFTFFLANNSATLARDILTETPTLFGRFIAPLFDLLISLGTVLVVSLALVVVDPYAAIGFAALFGGGYAIIYRLCRRLLLSWGRVRMEASRIKYKTTNEMLSAQREVRLLNCRSAFLERFTNAQKEEVRTGIYTELVTLAPRQSLEVLGFLLIVCLIGTFRASGREIGMVLPLLSIYAVGAVRLLPHFQSIFTALAQLRNTKPVFDRLAPLIKERVETVEIKAEPLEWEKSLALKSIHFSYPEPSNPVLQGLSCCIEKNSVIGFVGSTGAGKTTLINILLGLLVPHRGTIEVDGEALSEDRLSAWQAQLGFVPQEIYLCDDTIAANVAFGEAKPDMQKVESALQLAALLEFVNTLPEGINTIVGERGVRLSGGQRQRLGIARALYRNPQTLIFDEATSALDSVTETAVMEAVRKLEGEKTIILIAHRVTTLKDCDTIYVLEAGQIVDSGTYFDLLARNETFQGFAQVSPESSR